MAFETVTRSRDELVVRGELDQAVASAVDALGKRLEQWIRQLTKNPPVPVVNVPPANVTVAAPNVTVQAEAPEPPETAEVNLTAVFPGMEQLRADVNRLSEILRQPVVRTVERDSNGLIVRITERRA